MQIGPKLHRSREIIRALSKIDLEKADIDFLKGRLMALTKGYH
jgi:hypothetical protein